MFAQIFFLTSTFTLILHLRLAKHWPELITSWCKMDKIMNATYGYPATLDRRLKVFTLLFMGLAITRAVVELFAVRFPDRPIPSHATVINTYEKFKRVGCLHKCHSCMHPEGWKPKISEKREEIETAVLGIFLFLL
ncbi:unnamed protein product [Acanthoscelides obtectus]|uniref:Uncharacterized protein n=1 Tax=Acanthoscelides obtectus TaxID=200917 RepID=A0A9P0K5F2_ACAOB|nr:unnamed protein product [Acanthoscelides obtectus]CAK1629665.1 hypothetical protein AOBTE_LOCUS5879 [Acanthoscelides obtectus]